MKLYGKYRCGLLILSLSVLISSCSIFLTSKYSSSLIGRISKIYDKDPQKGSLNRVLLFEYDYTDNNLLFVDRLSGTLRIYKDNKLDRIIGQRGSFTNVVNVTEHKFNEIGNVCIGHNGDIVIQEILSGGSGRQNNDLESNYPDSDNR